MTEPGNAPEGSAIGLNSENESGRIKSRRTEARDCRPEDHDDRTLSAQIENLPRWGTWRREIVSHSAVRPRPVRRQVHPDPGAKVEKKTMRVEVPERHAQVDI